MTTHHFGTDINPAQYVEIADPVNAGQVIRPDAGTVVKVRSAPDLTDLPSVTTGAYGYFEVTTTDIPLIYISADNWATTIGPLVSSEATTAAVSAGVAAATALTRSGVAQSTADAASTAAASAQAAVQLLAQQIGSGTGGTTDYNALDNKPVIPPKSELTVPVVWDGTKYTVPAGYKQRLFIGPPTADPGVLAQDNDEWIKVTP